MTLPQLKATFPGGTLLSVGQLQQLQWVLPSVFCPRLVAMLSQQALAGAKLRFTHAGVEHWWESFDAQRMLTELLHQPSHNPFARDALLPIAGCGHQRTTLYWVNVRDLGLWHSEIGALPAQLGLTLADVLATAVAEPRARARRRLPPKTRRPRGAQTDTPRPRRRSKSPPALCTRTLLLFG